MAGHETIRWSCDQGTVGRPAGEPDRSIVDALSRGRFERVSRSNITQADARRLGQDARLGC